MSAKYICIVDDDAVQRRMLRMILESIGFACTEAEDGKEAYDLIRQEPPDLLITDFEMPIFNGIELIEAVRRDPRLRHLPILMISGSDVGGLASEAKAAFLPKGGTSAREIRQKVQEMLVPPVK